MVGSIGVISQSLGFHEVIQKLGIESRVYTAGKSKAFNNPLLPQKVCPAVWCKKGVLKTTGQIFFALLWQILLNFQDFWLEVSIIKKDKYMIWRIFLPKYLTSKVYLARFSSNLQN